MGSFLGERMVTDFDENGNEEYLFAFSSRKWPILFLKHNEKVAEDGSSDSAQSLQDIQWNLMSLGLMYGLS